MDTPVFCASCLRYYDSPGISAFELFGLRPEYDLDPQALRRAYLRLARDVHPDRAGGVAPDAARVGLRIAARVNHAYEMLADPVSRAEHLLDRAGGPDAAQDKSVDPDVLVETLSLREQADDARALGDAEQLDALRRDAAARHAALLAQIADAARALPGSDADRRRLRVLLNAVRYYARMIEAFV